MAFFAYNKTHQEGGNGKGKTCVYCQCYLLLYIYFFFSDNETTNAHYFLIVILFLLLFFNTINYTHETVRRKMEKF